VLSIRGLRKRYPNGVHALRGVDLEIPPGMFGLLGPNGAGKTTLMKIAATLLEPDGGSMEMDGVDLLADRRRTRRLLGYLPQDFGFYPVLTAEQTLDYFAKLKGVVDYRERWALIGALLERVNLSSAARRRVGEFSGGMRQRLGIAQALIGDPRLVIVDEPTAGLDPEERGRFYALLSEVASAGTTVVLSTHIVSDVSSLCATMAIIRAGEIIAACTPAEALLEIAGSVWEATLSRADADRLSSSLQLLSTGMHDAGVRVRVFAGEGRPGDAFTPVPATLEDYYLGLVSAPLATR
jgi:ABC-2 type transport system ATP-binding protein